MKKNKFSLHGLRRAGLWLIVLCAVLIGSNLWLREMKSNSQDDLIQLKNETASFQLVSHEKRDGRLVVRMRNVSKKGITAYSVSTRPNSRTDTDCLISGHVIKPGDVEEMEFLLSSLEANVLGGKRTPIRILTVVFEDRTTEGDPAVAGMIQDTRSGEKIQLKRINNLIRLLLRTSDADLSTAFESLKSSVASLPEEPNKDQSTYVRDGLHNAKEDLLRVIDRLEREHSSKSMSVEAGKNRTHNLRVSLDKVVQENEKRLDRY